VPARFPDFLEDFRDAWQIIPIPGKNPDHPPVFNQAMEDIIFIFIRLFHLFFVILKPGKSKSRTAYSSIR
jgi:hypothetical protein